MVYFYSENNSNKIIIKNIIKKSYYLFKQTHFCTFFIHSWNYSIAAGTADLKIYIKKTDFNESKFHWLCKIYCFKLKK